MGNLKNWEGLKSIDMEVNGFEQIKNKVMKSCDCKFFRHVLLLFRKFLFAAHILPTCFCTTFFDIRVSLKMNLALHTGNPN